MAGENPTWGRRRIQAELHFPGYEVAALTVAKYMRRPSGHPSPTWRAFLAAHCHEIAAVDFFDYNVARPHQSLGNDSPLWREVQPVPSGRILTIPEVGGLHRRYHRAA